MSKHMGVILFRAKYREVAILGISILIVSSLLVGVERAKAVGSITINNVSLTLLSDPDGNSMVNIGDTVRVELTVSNTDGGCTANTTATANMTTYGLGAVESLSCITDNGGVADVLSGDFIVSDAGLAGIDVGGDDPASQVNVVTADLDEFIGPDANSNSLGEPADTIAPTVTAANISVSGANGLDGAFIIGDTPIFTWDPSEETDMIASVLVDAGLFIGSATSLPAGLDGGVYTASVGDPLDSQDDSGNNISVTVSDDGGNQTTGIGTNDYVVDTTVPTLYSARISGPNEITVIFSEEMSGATDDFTDFRIAGEEAARSIDDLAGSETAEFILTFGGDPAGENATGTIDINFPVMLSVEDTAGNELAQFDDQLVNDGQGTPSAVFVDDDYSGADDAGGHVWGYDAFSTVQNGIDAAAEGGTVNVLAGDYESNRKITISTNGLQLVGPGIGDGISRAIIRNTNCTKHTIAILSSNVRIEGLQLEQKSGGVYCERNGQPVVRLNAPAVGTAVVGNDIAGGENGILFPYDTSEGLASDNVIHDNSHGIAVNSPSTTIENNEIYDSSGTAVSVGYGIWFRCVLGTCDSAGSIVRGNNIHNNGYGVYFNALDQTSPVHIGPDNTITSNDEGVYVLGNSGNVFVNGNTITGNITPDSGLHVQDDSSGLNATRNYWGDASGPHEDVDNPSGTGDTITIINSSGVIYRPFYIDSARTTFLADPANTEIAIGSLDPAIISIPGDVTNATIDVGDLLTGLSGTLPDLTINVTTSIGAITAEIASGTVVTGGAGWSGVINVPTIRANSSVTVSGGDVQSVFEIGFGDIALTFDKGVRILIPNKAGQRIGYSRSGVFTEITATCAADSQVAGDALLPGGDCKINFGNDLVVWTKHFSLFATFTTAATGGTGGGGVGFLPVTSVAQRASSGATVPLSFTVNSGAVSTNNRLLTLDFNADASKVKGYAVSLTADFKDASILPYKSSVNYELPDKSGTYSVYVKYYSTTGNASEIMTKSIAYQTGSKAGKTEVRTVLVVKNSFKRTLMVGSRGADVKLLQQYLNAYGYTVSVKGAGSAGKETTTFGTATKKALIRWQNDHAAEVLTPLHLKKGTGVLGVSSRKLLNSL